jgi:soluble lytic murein transglycosylase-like protein
MGNGTSDVERWRPMVALHFPESEVDNVLCIMRYESGGNPMAWNSRSTATGLMQVMFKTWGRKYGYSTRSDLDSGWDNLRVAREVWNEQGYRKAWPNTSRKCGL